MEGDDDLDSAWDRDSLSETLSLRLRDPQDLILPFSSVGVLNFRCNVSNKLSLFVFFFISLDEDFPHHEGMS